MSRSPIPFLGVLLLAALDARSAEWLSPDGKLAIQLPRPERFIQEPSPPAPALAKWSTADGEANVVVVQVANPSNVPLVERGLVEGTLKQLSPGKIISTTRTTISGIPAYTIVANGTIAGTELFIAQVIVGFNGQTYKIMVGSRVDPLLDNDLVQILGSVRILEQAPQAPRARPPLSAHDVSVKTAQWGIWLLAAACALYCYRRLMRRKTPQSAPVDFGTSTSESSTDKP